MNGQFTVGPIVNIAGNCNHAGSETFNLCNNSGTFCATRVAQYGVTIEKVMSGLSDTGTILVKIVLSIATSAGTAVIDVWRSAIVGGLGEYTCADLFGPLTLTRVNHQFTQSEFATCFDGFSTLSFCENLPLSVTLNPGPPA